MHIVFDSSLSYLVATSRHVQRPTEIVIGGDLSGFVEESVAHRNDGRVGTDVGQAENASSGPSRTSVLKWITRYAAHYAQAVLGSVPQTTLLETDGIAFYRIRLGAREISEGSEPPENDSSVRRAPSTANTIK